MMKIKAALFDLDGTLLNTVPAVRHTCNLVLAHYHLPEIGDEQVKNFAGDGAGKLIERCLAYTHGAAELKEEALAVYLDYFKEGCLYQLKPYDGIPKMLQGLKRGGIQLGVISNKPQAMTETNIYSQFGRELFTLVYGQREGVPRKPDPTVPLAMAKSFGALPEECLYVGDTNTDMMTGLAAGMKTIGVLWGFRGREELAAFHPAALVTSPLEILDYL